MNHWISFLRHNSFFFITVFFFKTVACKSVWYSFIKKLISSYKNSKTSVKNWIQIPNYNVFSRNYTTIITDVGKTEKLKTYVFFIFKKEKNIASEVQFFLLFQLREDNLWDIQKNLGQRKVESNPVFFQLTSKKNKRNCASHTCWVILHPNNIFQEHQVTSTPAAFPEDRYDRWGQNQ